MVNFLYKSSSLKYAIASVCLFFLSPLTSPQDLDTYEEVTFPKENFYIERMPQAISYNNFERSYEALKDKKLDKDSRWQNLLHLEDFGFNYFKNSIKTSRFYFSTENQIKPELELKETLRSFFKKEIDYKENQHPTCLFPARKKFFKDNLAGLHFPEVKCQDLDKFLMDLKTSEVGIAYVEANENSMSESFGQIYLIFRDKNKDMQWGYPEKPKGDFWFYALDLNDNEKLTLKLHLWELKDVKESMGYFGETQTHQVSRLIEIASPRSYFYNRTKLITLPLDALRFLKEDRGFIRYIEPSQKTEEPVDPLDRRIKAFIEDPSNSHGTSRIGLSMLKTNKDKNVLIWDFKLLMHDLLDPVSGYSDKKQFDVGRILLSLDSDQKFLLKKINLFDFKQFRSWSEKQQPLSWQISLGMESFDEYLKQSYLSHHLAVGVSEKGNNMIGYLFLTYDLEKNQHYLGADIGLLHPMLEGWSAQMDIKVFKNAMIDHLRFSESLEGRYLVKKNQTLFLKGELQQGLLKGEIESQSAFLEMGTYFYF